ncbi:MAG TPA: hypothetical protein VKL19_06895 [Thermoanaerobaculia bacterium]|nr:hypothetical protein [Thermoanaerobaculia bacterium]
MLLLFWLAALNGQPLPVDDLIAKVVNAYGGAAAWSKVTSFREIGTVTPAMRPGQGALTREWQRPDKLRVEIVYPTNTEIRIVNGDHGTQNGKEATGMGLDAMRLQAARLVAPLLLLEKKSSLHATGNSIEIALSPSMTLTLEIDPQSGHIVRSTSKTSGTEFSTDYSDFRIVDGLLFALREENTAGGTKTGTNEISKVEVTRVK